MIILRRHGQRYEHRRSDQQTWHTFHEHDLPEQRLPRFGVLVAVEEIRIAPGGASERRSSPEAEVFTYVYRGALAQEDSTGGSTVLQAGEFQHMTVSRGVRRKEINASSTEPVHLFRFSLRPAKAGLASAHEERRYPAAQRHNRLCVVASQDGRVGSLHTLQDLLVCSSVLDPGHHVVHEFRPGRSVWLHVICGEVTLHDHLLESGDGAGLTEVLSASLTARESSEVLLVDLPPDPSPVLDGREPRR
jgi:hypothetical protein